jgi:transcriptional regulator with XRE-family HTH domain
VVEFGPWTPWSIHGQSITEGTAAVVLNEQPDRGEGRTADGKERLTLAIVEALKNKGLSQSDIARQYGVTRQYVSWIKHTYGGRLTPRELALQHFPFQVPVEMGQTSPYRRLRDHSEYIATGGVGMTEDQLQRLRTFYRKLREGNQVLEFDPNIPPIPGVSSNGGWAYWERLPEDGDLLIRVNEFTNITDKGRDIWRFPAVDP